MMQGKGEKRKNFMSTVEYVDNITKRRRKENERRTPSSEIPKRAKHIDIEQTKDKIPTPDEEKLLYRCGGVKLSAMAARALKGGKIVASLIENNPERIMYNHKIRIYTYGERLVKENNMSTLYKLDPAIQEETFASLKERNACPSSLLLSFILSADKWISYESHNGRDQPTEQLPQSSTSSTSSSDSLEKYISQNIYKQNRRCIDHDTPFPAVERKESKMACVIVGCERDISELFSEEKTYGEACNNIMNMLSGQKGDINEDEIQSSSGSRTGRHERRKTGHCTANNFPVLIGMEHEKVVSVDSISGKKTPTVIDFCKQTSTDAHPGGLVPLLLTTCCEAIHRVNLQYVQLLYDIGAVRLNPEPVDSSGVLYRLCDFDSASLIMQMKRSTVLLYSVMISCTSTSCRVQHNHLWQPNIETTDPKWLDKKKCNVCGSALKNDSCFVINGGQMKWRRDPASVHRITYQLYKSKKNGKIELPEGVKRKEDMPQYEHVTPEVNAKHLKIYTRKDYERKIQRNHFVSLTAFIPISFDRKRTEKKLRMKFGGQVRFDRTQTVKAYCFVNGKEHVINLILNRFKISLSLNKKFHISKDALKKNEHIYRHFQRETFHMRETVEETEKQLILSIPGVQSSKRIGVQTIDEEGKVCKHKTGHVARSSVRKGSKLAGDQRFVEEADMYTAIHFWSVANTDDNENNFTKYGPTLMAGLINNFVMHGKATVKKENEKQIIFLLESGKYQWLNVKEIVPAMSSRIVGEIYNRKMKQINIDIDRLQATIREKDREIERMKERETSLESELGEMSQALRDKTNECQELKNMKDLLERDLRAVKRANKTLMRQHEDLEKKINCMEERNEEIEERMKQHCEETIAKMMMTRCKEEAKEEQPFVDDERNEVDSTYVTMQEENTEEVCVESDSAKKNEDVIQENVNENDMNVDENQDDFNEEKHDIYSLHNLLDELQNDIDFEQDNCPTEDIHSLLEGIPNDVDFKQDKNYTENTCLHDIQNDIYLKQDKMETFSLESLLLEEEQKENMIFKQDFIETQDIVQRHLDEEEKNVEFQQYFNETDDKKNLTLFTDEEMHDLESLISPNYFDTLLAENKMNDCTGIPSQNEFEFPDELLFY